MAIHGMDWRILKVYRMLHLKEKNIYRIFETGALLKALDGALEIIGGLAFVFYGTANQLILSLLSTSSWRIRMTSWRTSPDTSFPPSQARSAHSPRFIS